MAAGNNIDRGGSNVVCALLYSTPTLLGEASKIWEVHRKSEGSPREVGRNFFLSFYPTRSTVKMPVFLRRGPSL